MLVRVCRAFGKSLDEVRSWDFDDYIGALEDTLTIPPIHESFWNAFCKKTEEPMPFRTQADRAKVFSKVEMEMSQK